MVIQFRQLVVILALLLFTATQLSSSIKRHVPLVIHGNHARMEMWLDAGRNIIDIDSFQINQKYRITWISADSPKEVWLQQEEPRTSAKNTLNLLAEKTRNSITITSEHAAFGYLSISCISCEPVLTAFRSPNSIQSAGGYSAEQLIQDFFIAGDCFDVENVTFRGVSVMAGIFTNGASSINMDEGIVICTGNINQILGPNSQTGITNDLGLTYQDPDIAEISQATLFDVASIEFDFRPKSDMISFEYVFASDEYCDYVNSEFNDKFGFFLSGPGIAGPFSNGAENIAYVPGTTDFVAINSINIQSNSTFYVDNVPLGQPQQPGSPFPCTADLAMQGAAINDIEYDGFTTVLQASSPVIECELYHIKIVIADQNDGLFDSAVFLKKNSFNAGGLSDLSVVYSRPDDVFMYEGCSDGYLEFFRIDPSTIDEDFVITFSVSPMSTAIAGIDYEALDPIVTIPAGQLSVRIPIRVFNDDILEGIERIILILSNSCRCSDQEVEIFINDLQPLTLNPINQSYCETTSTIIDVGANGGLEPLNYQWNNGSIMSSIQVTLAQTDTFYVTVTDDCGNMRDTFAVVEIINENSATFESDDIEYCPGEIIDTTVIINYLGNPPFVIQITRDGILIDTILVSENSHPFQITSPGLYAISSLQAQDCQINPIDDLLISVVELTVEADITHIACSSDLLGTVDLNVTGDYGPYTYSWSDGFVTTNHASSFLEGIYQVTITDQAGCQISEAYEILKLTGPEILLDSISHITCKNDDQGFISITASGGSGSYSYSWIGLNESGTTLENLTPGMYSIEVYDEEFMCLDTATFEILDLRADVLFDLSADTFYCETDTGKVRIELMEIANYNISWSAIDNEIISTADSSSIEITQPGIYFVKVENILTGCSSIDTIQTISYLFQPYADAADMTLTTCLETEILLDGSSSLTSPHTQFNWSTTEGLITGNIDSIATTIVGPGIYILTVTDTQSHCVDIDTILVTQILSFPTAQIDLPGVLNCKNQQIFISGNQGVIQDDLRYSWSSPTISIEQTTDPLQIIVNDTGIVVLQVIDTITFCEHYDTVHISENFTAPNVVVSPDDTFTCITQSLVISGAGSSSGTDIKYQWTTVDGVIDGSTESMNILVDAPGVYYLTVTDTSNGCKSVDSVIIYPDDRLPSIRILPVDTLTCKDLTILIDGSNSSSGPEFKYSWATIDGQILSPTDSSIIEISKAGTYILEVINENNGCKIQRSVLVSSNFDVPIINLSTPEALTCAISQIMLDSDGSSVGSQFDYFWTTTNGNIISGETSPTIIIASSGIYTLEIINNQNGCRSIDSIEVQENYNVPDILNDTLFTLSCINTEISFEIILSESIPVRYDWQLMDGTLLTDGPSHMTFSEPGFVFVTITSLETGCTSSRRFTLLEDLTAPIIQLEEQLIVDCGPFEKTLVATILNSELYHIIWTTDDGLITSSPNLSTISISSIGTYTVEALNPLNGCKSSEEIHVINDGNISTILDIQQPACDELEGIIELNSLSTGTPPYLYGLNSNAVDQSNWPITLPPGEYTIQIIDSEGCVDNQYVVINPPREITLNILEIGTLDFGDSVTLQPEFNIDESEIKLFEWLPIEYLTDPNLLRPTSRPLEDITYQLTIQDFSGCEASASVDIIMNKTVQYFVPNVFTPNDDGINDRISIFTNHNIKQVRSFQIFNRWGDRVFENYDFPPNDLHYGWDGRFRDKILDPAVFVYQAELITVFNTPVMVQGDITLVK